MSFFEWDKSLDVGVDSMNEQHKKLITLMDVVYQKNLTDSSKQEIIHSINELISFVVQHFKDEEAYMEQIKFPGLTSHRMIHGHLLSDLTKSVEDFKNSSANKVGSDFIMFLKLWLSTHIRGIDTKYGMI